MRDPLLVKLLEALEGSVFAITQLSKIMPELRRRAESEIPLAVHSAQHVVDIATLMFDRIMSIVLEYEPGSEVTRSLVAADKHPKARVVKAAVADIIEELTASELDQCLLEVEDSKGETPVTPVKGSLSDKAFQEESRDPRQSSEANDNEGYGYIVCEVSRDPGLEIQRDDEAGVFANDDEARLQFVTDLERGSTYARSMAKELMGRPRWAADVDNETMFYCSKSLWDLFSIEDDPFGGDDREARRVAWIAAETFENMHADADWDKEDYTEAIWDFVGVLASRVGTMEDPGSIKSTQQMLQVLYGKPTVQEQAKKVLKRLESGEDLTGAEDLLGDLTNLLEQVAKP